MFVTPRLHSFNILYSLFFIQYSSSPLGHHTSDIVPLTSYIIFTPCWLLTDCCPPPEIAELSYMEPVVIKTPRLQLKGLTPVIIHHLFNTLSKEEIMQFFGTDEKGYAHYLEMHEQGMETHRITLFVFLLISDTTGETIGECGFHTFNKTHARAEVFYTLRHESDKRKGYMTEALEAVLNFGFTQLGLQRVEALVDSQNTASVRLLEKYGFTKEGTIRAHYRVNGVNEDSDCYSLLSREWKRGEA